MTDAPIPHSREAEESLLGSILIAPEVINDALAIVSADDFYIQRNRWIWEAMVSLYNANRAIDIVTVGDVLKSKGILDNVGGSAYLTSLLGCVPTSSNAVEYAKIMYDKGSRKRGIIEANEIAKMAMDESTPFDPSPSINRLLRSRKQSCRTELDQSIAAHLEWLMANTEKTGNFSGIPGGIPNIDLLLDGYEVGTTTMLFGEQKLGKSMLFAQQAFYAAHKMDGKEQVYVKYYSMETPDILILNRQISVMTRIPTYKMKQGNLSQEDMQKIDAAYKDLADNYTIDIVYSPHMTTSDIRSDLLRARMSGKDVKVAVIDYAGLLEDVPDDRFSKGADELDRQQKAVRNLVQMGKDLNVSNWVISILNADNKAAGRRLIQYDVNNVLLMFVADQNRPDIITVQAKYMRDQQIDPTANEAYIRRDKLFPIFYPHDVKMSAEEVRQFVGAYQMEEV